MAFASPISVTPINNFTDLDIGLRLNQRVTAQVMSVTGTTVALEVDGHPVVAQLTSAGQAAALASQRVAHFIVTELTSEAVTLKFIRNERLQPSPPGSLAPEMELAGQILESANIPITAANLTLTRAMLRQHLPVTPELLKELQDALVGNGAWTESDAELAAAMKSAGLPVTAQSLALASRPNVQTADALSSLLRTLTKLSEGVSGEALAQLNLNIRILDALVIRADDQSSKMAERLKALVRILGRSLENILLEQSAGDSIPEESLVSLVKLQQMLVRLGAREEAQAIQKSLTDIRQGQLMNVKPNPVPAQGEWSEIGLMLQSPQQKAAGEFFSARLKIAHEEKAGSSKINPEYTRVILQVDLEPNETVEVDLSLIGGQIRTSVTAPDPAWSEQARNEAPSLAEALARLGYRVQDAQIGVGAPRPFQRIQIASGNARPTRVNIEV